MKVSVPLAPAWLRWAGVGVVAAVIFYASILTAPPETVLDTRLRLVPLDKWRHFLAYAAFGYALAYATTDWGTERQIVALAVVGATIGYGVGIELLQSQVGRTFSIVDAYANGLGGVLVVPYYLLRPYLVFKPLGLFVGSLGE